MSQAFSIRKRNVRGWGKCSGGKVLHSFCTVGGKFKSTFCRNMFFGQSFCAPNVTYMVANGHGTEDGHTNYYSMLLSY